MPEGIELPIPPNESSQARFQPESAVVPVPEIKETNPAFSGSDALKMREIHRKDGGIFPVLVADIDDTFKMKARNQEHDQATEQVIEAARVGNIPIVAITGNSFEIVQQKIENGELPYFEVIAGSVGTEVYVLRTKPDGTKEYVKDEAFQSGLVASGYDKKAVSQLSAILVDECIASNPSWQLDFQHPEAERGYLEGKSQEVQPFKTSFFVMADSSQTLEEIQTSFQERFPLQKIVIAEEIGYNSNLSPGMAKKFCIDVLPVTKADAANYVSQELGAEVTAVAGDSGNDADMLANSGDIKIQVGGAKPELVRAMEAAFPLDERKKGSRSFSRIQNEDGSAQLIYRGKGLRRGPQDLIRAYNILKRAQGIGKIREAKSDTKSSIALT